MIIEIKKVFVIRAIVEKKIFQAAEQHIKSSKLTIETLEKGKICSKLTVETTVFLKLHR